MKFSLFGFVFLKTVSKYVFSTALLYFAVLSLATTSCTTIKKGNKIDPELLPYVSSFVEDSKGSVIWDDFRDFNIIFVNEISGFTIGTCNRYDKVIKIERIFWDKPDSSYLDKQALMYHELGHCILDRNHTQPKPLEPFRMDDINFMTPVITFRNILGDFTVHYENEMLRKGLWKTVPPLEDGCDGSIMSPILTDIECLSKHWDYYVYELFSGDERDNSTNSGESHETIENLIDCEKEPEIVNETDEWTDFDKKVLADAQIGCYNYYGTCVGTFYKRKEEQTYGVLCR